MNKHITNDRVTKWLLLLQEFNITIVDRLGRENLVANFLSRINHCGEMEPINDDFPDEHLFSLSVKTPWFADLANYLTTRKLPQHLTSRENKKTLNKVLITPGSKVIFSGQDLI